MINIITINPIIVLNCIIRTLIFTTQRKRTNRGVADPVSTGRTGAVDVETPSQLVLHPGSTGLRTAGPLTPLGPS